MRFDAFSSSRAEFGKIIQYDVGVAVHLHYVGGDTRYICSYMYSVHARSGIFCIDPQDISYTMYFQ